MSIRVHPWFHLIAIAICCALGACDSLDELGNMGEAFKQTTPSEAARDAVDPTDPDKRRQGMIMLANAPFGGVDAYISFYRDAVLNERDPIVKAAAIQALSKHGEPADAVRISPHLAHDNDQVRWAAARGLQRLHNPAVVPDLLTVVRNEAENRDVRIAAAHALAQYPEDRVFQGLVGALNARELAINRAAETSLMTLTGQSLGLEAETWLNWYDDVVSQGGGGGGRQAFASQRQYLYPVYSRDIAWWEKIAFWSPKVFEKPGPPAGLGSADERRTYEATDDAGAATSTPDAPATTRRETYGDE